MIFPNRTTRFILNSLLSLAVSVALFGGLALAASAQISSDYGLTETAIKAGLPHGNTSPVDIAAVIVNMVLGIIGAILVILVIYGGFTWMTAAGDEQKISKAKNLLGNAVVGLIIVLAAYAIASFTINSLKKSTGFGGTGTSQAQTCTGVGGYCATPPCTPNTDIGKYDCQDIQTCCRGSGT